MKKIHILLIACLIVSLTHAIPSLINYQGRLTDPNGDALTGNKSMSVSIYDAVTNGSSLYTEDVGEITLDSNGIYSFSFGTNATDLISALQTIGEHWLELTVEGSAQAPRERILSVPFSLQANASYDAIGDLRSELDRLQNDLLLSISELVKDQSEVTINENSDNFKFFNSDQTLSTVIASNLLYQYNNGWQTYNLPQPIRVRAIQIPANSYLNGRVIYDHGGTESFSASMESGITILSGTNKINQIQTRASGYGYTEDAILFTPDIISTSYYSLGAIDENLKTLWFDINTVDLSETEGDIFRCYLVSENNEIQINIGEKTSVPESFGEVLQIKIDIIPDLAINGLSSWPRIQNFTIRFSE